MPFRDRLTGNAYRVSWRNRNIEKARERESKRRADPAYRRKKAEDARRHRKANPDLYRDKSYRHKYGITLAQYNDMHAAQGGCCAICKESDRGSVEKPYHRLHVDHSHETGKVRGLLCRRCNTSVGFLEHVEAHIRGPAEAYLARWQSRR